MFGAKTLFSPELIVFSKFVVDFLPSFSLDSISATERSFNLLDLFSALWNDPKKGQFFKLIYFQLKYQLIIKNLLQYLTYDTPNFMKVLFGRQKGSCTRASRFFVAVPGQKQNSSSVTHNDGTMEYLFSFVNKTTANGFRLTDEAISTPTYKIN